MKEITQGEWKFIRNENNFEIKVFGVNNWIIAQTITNEKQDEANAKLIACAPEMLEMLKESIYAINHIKKTYRDHGHCQKYLYLCEQLIKKATE